VEEKVEEEVKMAMVSQSTAELTKAQAEKEKTQVLSMIPDRYKQKQET
jgi:hypothetical protein